MSLRSDIICEKTRSPQEIRNELAKHLRIMRRQRPHQSIWRNGIIAAMKWMLREDISCKDFYKNQYGREYPE